MTDEELKELEEVHARSTPGEWVACGAICCSDVGWIDGTNRVVCSHYTPKSTHAMDYYDAEFCAMAHEKVPALIAEVRRLKAQIMELT